MTASMPSHRRQCGSTGNDQRANASSVALCDGVRASGAASASTSW
jgi:hypothetical protein